MNVSDQSNLHAGVRELLPWYVNETLNDVDRDRVVSHLKDCVVCRDDVAVLSAAQRALFVNDVEAIMPATTATEVLNTRPGRSGKSHANWYIALIAAAASIVVVVFAVQTVGLPTSNDNRIFETATTPSQDSHIDYVLRLGFEASLAVEERQSLVDGIEGVSSWSVDDSGSYVVHLRMSNPTLARLEDIEGRVRSIPGVRSAEFVAMQVPVR